MDRETFLGGLYAVAAFGTWGVVPLYWRTVRFVPPLEMLAHRVVWALPVLLVLLAVRGRTKALVHTLRDRRHLGLLLATAALVATNWLVFIWAMANDHVLDASLGYYLNPLLNVVLGVVVLRERLGRRQRAAVLLAAAGVAWLTFSLGVVPWISLVLATTFGLYGLLRKVAGVDALVGLAVEVTFLAPVALLYLAALTVQDRGTFLLHGATGAGWIVAAGVVTAFPLLWFTNAARRLRYATLGFFQYLAPTGQFLLAVFAFGEAFTPAHGVAFGCIWAAVLLYLSDAGRGPRVIGGSPVPAKAM